MEKLINKAETLAINDNSDDEFFGKTYKLLNAEDPQQRLKIL